MSCFRNKVMVRRRIRGGQPVLNVPLQLITYRIPSGSATEGGRETTNVSSCSFHLMLGEEQERPQVSQGYTCFARDTYSYSVRYHPSVPFHLMGRVFRQISARNHENMSHLPEPPSKYHGRHPGSVQQPTILRPSLTDPISRGQPESCLSPTITLRISL
jgi:hypothetical protein